MNVFGARRGDILTLPAPEAGGHALTVSIDAEALSGRMLADTLGRPVGLFLEVTVTGGDTSGIGIGGFQYTGTNVYRPGINVANPTGFDHRTGDPPAGSADAYILLLVQGLLQHHKLLFLMLCQ